MFTQQEKRKKKRNSSEPAGLVHRSPIAQRNLRGLENLHHDVCGSVKLPFECMAFLNVGLLSCPCVSHE